MNIIRQEGQGNMALNEQQKRNLITVFVMGLIGFGVIGYYWWMFGKANYDTAVKQRSDFIAKTEELNNELDKINRFERATEDEFERLEAQLAEVARMLPQSRMPVEFFSALRDILGRTGVITRKLEPETVEEFEGYAEIPYAIAASSRFHECGFFLSYVEQNPDRFMRVKTFKITNDNNRPSLHPVEVNVATFMLK